MTLLYPDLMACYNKVCFNLAKCVIKGLHCSIYFLGKTRKKTSFCGTLCPGPWREKTCLQGLRTTKVQTNLRIPTI